MSSASDHWGMDVVTAEMLTNRDYTQDVIAARRPGVRGVIIGHSDSHGVCYKVRHLVDRTEAYYDPDELYEIGRRLDNVK